MCYLGRFPRKTIATIAFAVLLAGWLRHRLPLEVVVAYVAMSGLAIALYAFDKANSRIVAFTKSNGKYVEQYRLEGHDDAWEGLRDFVVLPGADADAPKTVWWISDTGLHSAVLEQAEGPAATPTPAPESPAASPAKTPRPKPTKTPRP